eukprot:gnl/Spiro4/14500_TR7812_c0_g1_i1.p1 gnl/Spiro4/14500_TR7812_c0_g1~~gnl/Spiro4/14500_TR7812_c0_g1_i1.p1  ORF type:complete len:158 (-),score=33.48 gnl/Spiro4/14500_TR7812_c0_g1_i1:9-482(-)
MATTTLPVSTVLNAAKAAAASSASKPAPPQPVSATSPASSAISPSSTLKAPRSRVRALGLPVKVGEMDEFEKRKLRAQKFGVNTELQAKTLSEAERASLRRKRFASGTVAVADSQAAKLSRAQRFGLPVHATGGAGSVGSVDDIERKRARAQRFAKK